MNIKLSVKKRETVPKNVFFRSYFQLLSSAFHGYAISIKFIYIPCSFRSLVKCQHSRNCSKHHCPRPCNICYLGRRIHSIKCTVKHCAHLHRDRRQKTSRNCFENKATIKVPPRQPRKGSPRQSLRRERTCTTPKLTRTEFLELHLENPHAMELSTTMINLNRYTRRPPIRSPSQTNTR